MFLHVVLKLKKKKIECNEREGEQLLRYLIILLRFM